MGNDTASLTLQRAFFFHEKGDFRRAAKLYRNHIKHDPHNFLAHHLLGTIEAMAGNLAEAMTANQRALAINPKSADAWLVHGNVLAGLKQPDEARLAFEKALTSNPTLAPAWLGLGNVLLELTRYPQALHAYQKAVGLQPATMQAWSGLAEVCSRLQRYEEAIAAYQRVLAFNAGSATTWLGLGNVLGQLKRHDAALDAFDKALELDPKLAEAWLGRGITFYELKRYADAHSQFDRAYTLKSNLAGLESARMRTKMHLCDWSDFDKESARLVSSVRTGRAPVLPFYLVALPSTPEEQLHCARTWMAGHHPISDEPVWRGERYDNGLINVGYLSSDFRVHPISLLIAEMLEHHDRSRFRTVGISTGPNDRSELRERVATALDQFIDVRDKSDDDVAKLIGSLKIDILVDLNGNTEGARSDILAKRAAPIQLNFLGYPGTMGIGYFDYIVADRVVIPDNCRQFYSEKIAYLPNCFQVNGGRAISDRTFTRAEFGLPADGFVFCCFNNSYKITPHIFDSWMHILNSVENCVLWLFEDSSESSANLRKEAAARGIGAQRLVFATRTPIFAEHLARLRLADLFLDTLPYNAHTTAGDALWAGLPILTCIGETFASRVAASILKAIDLPELITATLQDYERRAIELATDPSTFEQIKRKLANNRLATPLFDTKRYTRHIETAYAAMYERQRSGLTPDYITVSEL